MRFAGKTALLVLLAATLAGGVAGRASAATPCWKQVINDWYDNEQIDGKYPIHCYREALKQLPPDLQNYSPIGDDINAAMLAAIRGPHKGGGAGANNAAGKDAHPSQGLISRVLGAFGANGSHKIPLPLVLLGILLAVLLTAAAYPRVARRLARRPQKLGPTAP